MDRRSRASQIVRALRRVNIEGSIFGQTVAVRFGLSESDVEALEHLADVGTTSAGQLADLMGLTTGAVTRVLDRLEQAGFIRRAADPTDRRRVIVSLVEDKAADIEALADRLARASEAELARYTADQLDAIADFLGRMSDVTRAETVALRGAADAGEATSGEHAAPLGGVTAGRFVFRGGTNELAVWGGSAAPADLYRAEFTGSIPQVRVRNGVVSVQYRGGRPWDWRKRAATFALNPAVPWDLAISGGAGRVTVDATLLDLRTFELSGGVERVVVTCGRPRGQTIVRVSGGSSQVHVERPTGVPVRLHVRGGVGGVELDGRRIPGASSIDLSAPGDQDAGRVEVEVSGGAGQVVVAAAGRDAGAGPSVTG